MRHPRVEYPSKLRKWPLTWSCCGIGRHRTGERPKIVAAQGKNPLPSLKEAPPNPTAPACFLHSIGTRVSWTSRRTVWRETDRGLMMPQRRQPASGTAATASTRNDAREPNSSPKKNDNAKPGLPRTTNHHLLRRLVSEPEVGVQAGIGVRCLVDRVVVQRRVVDRAVVD